MSHGSRSTISQRSWDAPTSAMPTYGISPTVEIPRQPTPVARPPRVRRITRRRVATVMAVVLVAGIGVAIKYRNDLLPVGRSQFSSDTAAVASYQAQRRAAGTKVVINADNTAHYVNEDFDSYGAVNSRLIDGMEAKDEAHRTTKSGSLFIRDDAVMGQHSIGIHLASGGSPTTVRTTLDGPIDLSRWSAGYLTMWMRIADRIGIAGVGVVLGDTKGATLQVAELTNLQSNFPNYPRDNDPFQDLTYPEATYAAEWTDFQLVRGWNYLPWRMDSATAATASTAATSGFDLRSVAWFEIVIQTTVALRAQDVLFDDLRIQDGLQKVANPTGGNWHAPLNMPQYGVFDVEQVGDGKDYALHLLNVRQRQYPSNGDHGRMLSAWGTPMNFAMRTRFTLNRLGRGGNTNNTWLRVLYDFDPDYDPGHDWFGGYISMDYGKAGLVTVIPLERFSTQDQEPKQVGRLTGYRKNFDAEENTVYEYDMTVRGQRTDVTIYKVRNDRLYQLVTLRYEFSRKRHVQQRYPFGIEVTGNVTATIHSLELMEL